jgi:hypothetical protein
VNEQRRRHWQQQTPTRVAVWRRPTTPIRKEATLATPMTGSAAPQPLKGTDAEAELEPGAEEALETAIRALRPHSAHPGVGGVVGQLQGVLDGAGRSAGEATDGEDDQSKIEKALFDLSAVRTTLQKSARPDPFLEQDLRKAERHVQLEYLAKHSGAYQGWRKDHGLPAPGRVRSWTVRRLK